MNHFPFPTDRRMKVKEWRKLAVLWRRWFGGESLKCPSSKGTP